MPELEIGTSKEAYVEEASPIDRPLQRIHRVAVYQRTPSPGGLGQGMAQSDDLISVKA